MTNVIGLNSYIKDWTNNEKRFQSFCMYPCDMTAQYCNKAQLLPAFVREQNVSFVAKSSAEYCNRDDRRHCTLQRSAVR